MPKSSGGTGSPPQAGAGSGPGRPLKRAPVVVVVVAALIAGGLIDRIGAPTAQSAAAVVEPEPVAAPAGALSSSWFCAGATGGRGLDAPGRIVIANSGSHAAAAVVTMIPGAGPSRRVPVRIQPDADAVVPETVPGGAAWIGAIVDVEAGAVAVDQVVVSPLGTSAEPCATSGSTQWYFANGMTMINAGVVVSLLNPYPSDSIVDLSFTTNEGIEAPEDFQGLVVPGGGMINVNLGSHLRRRTAIATTVTAVTGRVVAWETRWASAAGPGAVLYGTRAANSPLADPAWPVPGLTVTLGSPSAGTEWAWPDGLDGDGIQETYLIYNPGPTTAQVRLSLSLGEGSAEPFDLSIGAYEVLSVVSDQQARIPAGVPHSAVLQSLNGVAVVAERTLTASGSRNGLGDLPGGRLAAERWLVPFAVADSAHDGWLILYNPGSTPARVSLTALARGHQTTVPHVHPLTVAAGQRLAIHYSSDYLVDEPVVVDASAPVFVESDFYGRGVTGISLSFGVPLTS